MSYDIYIGEAKVETYLDDNEPGELAHASIGVEEVKHPDTAPQFPNDGMTGAGNSRHPGYRAWDEFCRVTGLHSLFFGEEGLMREHPGAVTLGPDHVEQVDVATEKWKAEHPEAVPGFGGFAFDKNREKVSENIDPILARLLWLQYWMRWAVENCKHPVIANH